MEQKDELELLPEELVSLSVDPEILKGRRKYFWEGQNYENNNLYSKAIDSYVNYSRFLDEADQHYPYKWIANLYEQLGEEDKALIALSKYASGCSKPIGAKVYRKVGERYLERNRIQETIIAFKKALECDPKVGVKKKLQQLIHLKGGSHEVFND